MDEQEKTIMRTERAFALGGIALFLLCSFMGSHAPAQPAAVRGVFGAGGGTVEDTTHRLSGTFGQPLVGKAVGTSNQSLGGFWYTVERVVVDAAESPSLPTTYDLDQNFPNPFHDATTIAYALPSDGSVEIILYDVQGREVSKPKRENQTAGYYEVKLEARDLSPGVYFYRLVAGQFTATRKMVLVR